MIMKLNMNFFIVTLAMQLVLRGLALAISSGAIMPGTPAVFNWLGGGRVAGVPVSVIATIGLVYRLRLCHEPHAVWPQGLCCRR